MKKLLFFIVISLFINYSIFGASKSKQIETITIPTTESDNLLLEWGEDFNSWKDVKNKLQPGWWDGTKPFEFYDYKLWPGDVKFIYAKKNAQIIAQKGWWQDDEITLEPNDTFGKTLNDADNVIVKDGIMSINHRFYRIPNNHNGYDYKVIEPTFTTGDVNANNVSIPKKPYWFKIGTTKKIIEARFKVESKMDHAFDIFLMSHNSRVSGNFTDVITFNNEKNVYFEEVDLMELTVKGKHTSKSEICLRGSPLYYKDGKIVYNEHTGYFFNNYNTNYLNSRYNVGNVEEWCKSFHTLTVELTQTSMVCYLDGIKYKELEWGKTLGKIPENQAFGLQFHNITETTWISGENVDWSADNTAVTSLDYLRVFSEK